MNMNETSAYAIIRAGGTQMKVKEGDTLKVNRVTGEAGAEVVFPEVLMLSAGGDVSVGNPTVAGARVVGEIVRHSRGKKIRVYRFKRKKGYQRTVGHRDYLTLVRIKSILAGGN